MCHCVQVIDNVPVEHTTKKQKPAQKAPVAEQAPAKAMADEVPPPSGKKGPSSQRRTSPRQKATDMAGIVKPGQELLGRRVRVFWTADQIWYKGSLCEYSAASGRHLCKYDDGDREWIDLATETYKLDEGRHSIAALSCRHCGVLGPSPCIAALRA